MRDLGKKNLLGIGISALDYEAAVGKVMDAAKAGRRCCTTALAVHGVITGATDRAHRARLNTFEVVTPDGQPVRWGLNWLYRTELADRVYGPKMTLLVCQAAAREGVPVYFYGSKPEVLEKLCEGMRVLCPGLLIAGAESSRFRLLTAEEQVATAARVRDSGAKILFAGLGCPRQEVFAYEMSKLMAMPILAVGAAFDYYSGLLAEPPGWVQAAGLQWLYRLVQEPGRLWKRYLFTNTRYVGMYAAQWLRVWRPQVQDEGVEVPDVRYG